MGFFTWSAIPGLLPEDQLAPLLCTWQDEQFYIRQTSISQHFVKFPAQGSAPAPKYPAGTLTRHHTCDLGLAISSAEKDTAIKATKQLLKGKQKVATCFRRMAGIFSLITTAPEQGQ